MKLPYGLRRVVNVYQNNSAAIECILALKMLRLSNNDRKWVLKRLPRQHANMLKKRIKAINISAIDDDIYNEIYKSLNLDFYFQKSDIDEKIEFLNNMPISDVNRYINNQPEASLKMMLLCRDKISWIGHIIPRIKISKDELNEFVNTNRNNKERIVDSTISFLYESLCHLESRN